MKEIGFTKSSSPYGWLGNMSRFPVIWDDKTYGTTEHLFQAMRFGLTSKWAELIRQEDNPYKAKQIAKANREHMIVEPCSEEDLANMHLCLVCKIKTHEQLKNELIGTDNAMIYEDVTHRGDIGSNLFWGAMKLPDGTWKGKNVVGELWMKIRKSLMPDTNIKSNLEIERRFLLKRLPDIKFEMILEITQCYLSPKGDSETERVRAVTKIIDGNVVGDQWIHTIKKSTDGLGVIEIEKDINWEDYSLGKEHSDRKISKTRYIIKHNSDGIYWEIDVFKNLNIIIAEIEIPSEDYKLQIPEFINPYILMEVTGMKQFSNSNLAE